MSMSMQIDMRELDKFTRDLEKQGADVDALTAAAVTNSLNRIQSEQRKRAAHRTGTLQRSILTEKLGRLDGKVTATEKYATYIEYGTGVYGPKRQPITPKSAKVLAFRVGGKQIFTKKVMGMRPKPFFKPGYEAAKGYVEQQFVKVTDRIVKELAKEKA